MMSRYRNALGAQREAIRALWGAVGVSLVCAVVMGVGWMRAPSELRIHIPPDLSMGAVVAPGEVLPASIYTFALYIWQQLYRWPNDGAKDYPARVQQLVNFLTPACYQDRLEDVAKRSGRRELAGRKRSVWEIPGRGYKVGRVWNEGAGSWLVTLDLQIAESYLGQPIKDRLASYQVRVRRYAVDPELNPWALAIDCLADAPRAIEVGDES